MTTRTATIDVITGQLTIANPATIDGLLANGITTDPWGADEYGMERADRALTDLGYQRTSEWIQSDAPDSEWTCTVQVRTGRPPLDPDGATRVAVTIPDTMLRSLDQRAHRHGNRSEQIRRAIDEHLRGAELAPTVTVTSDSDPQTVADQITDVLVYLQHVSSAINQAGAALRWMGGEDFEHQFDVVEGRIGDLFTALSMAQGPYAQKAREAACAAIPEDV